MSLRRKLFSGFKLRATRKLHSLQLIINNSLDRLTLYRPYALAALTGLSERARAGEIRLAKVIARLTAAGLCMPSTISGSAILAGSTANELS
ncbi:hypothetical protein RRG08_021805 [Elysia crispata]|uniref:Uncharacterized protein n=1 Tax=Elysia crispata TaxID=231223 RepID=A0AAE0ZY45_9GAST|nr:hypothetical protein RRG08_021805 [Elysia crispata]